MEQWTRTHTHRHKQTPGQRCASGCDGTAAVASIGRRARCRSLPIATVTAHCPPVTVPADLCLELFELRHRRLVLAKSLLVRG